MGNNPVMGIDPDGEWVHLVIGAAIGGTINWIANGAKFNAKGLAAFGVGAVAGALSAGVGAGVSSALAKGGSFGAGFIGSAAAKTATTSFLSGAAIGASSGFAGGFTSGLGNGLLGGQNFGQALGSGLKMGGIGALSGGVLGGLGGGIDAVKDSRHFFNGAKDKIVADYNISMPNVLQGFGTNDCGFACMESTDAFYGGGLKQQHFASHMGNPADGVNVETVIQRSGFIGERIAANPATIGQTIDKKIPVLIAGKTGGKISHAVMVTKVEVIHRIKTNATYKVIYKMQVMDPNKRFYTTVGKHFWNKSPTYALKQIF